MVFSFFNNTAYNEKQSKYLIVRTFLAMFNCRGICNLSRVNNKDIYKRVDWQPYVTNTKQ